YWCEVAEATYFATEAKALLRVLPWSRAFDLEGVTDFLAFGCTLDCRTLFKGISLLPGASLWTFEGARNEKTRYFTPDKWEAQTLLSVDDFQDALEQTAKSVFPKYFDSSSPVAISL